MINRFFIYLYFFSLPLQAQLQPLFWKETSAFPTQDNASGNISIATDKEKDLIYAGTLRSGIYRSSDQGASWTRVLACSDTAITKILVNGEDLFALGANVLFYSSNQGQSWTRRLPGTSYPLSDLIVLASGRLVVSAAGVSEISPGNEEYQGDGIFISDNKGLSWTNSSAGIGFRKAVSQLALLPSGMIAGAMNSFDGWGGGIIYSNDHAQTWNRLNNPAMKLNDTLPVSKMYLVHCLEAGPGDSVYFSFEGVSQNFAVAGGLKSSMSDLLAEKPLLPYRINALGFAWDNKPFYSLFFTADGRHAYSSLHTPNSTAYGGPYFHDKNKGGWKREPSGMLPVSNSYLQVQYAQDKAGRVYAIHHTDHRVYYTDISVGSPLALADAAAARALHIYPNPAREAVKITLPHNGTWQLRLLNTQGQILRHQIYAGEPLADLKLEGLRPGIYLVELRSTEALHYKQLLVD